MVEWMHRMMWAHPSVFVCLYAALAGLWLDRSWRIVHRTVIGLFVWVDSHPIRRWIYARRERRWLAKQPKPRPTPYRGE